MTPDLWRVLIIASAPGIIALVVLVVGTILALGETRSKVRGIDAKTVSTNTETIQTMQVTINNMARDLANITTKNRRLSTELASVQHDARVYVKELRSQGDEIARQANELDLYKDTVQYLWLGTVDNINFMKAQGLDPPFEPKLNYRGDNDFDYSDWEWLDSPPDGIGNKNET